MKLLESRHKSTENYFLWRKKKVRRICKSLNISSFSNKKILEVGCGIGAICSAVKELGGDITGIDISFNVVSKARSLCNKHVNFLCMNAEKLAFKSNSFDFLILSSMVEHVSNPEIIIMEGLRVLKRGGRMYVDFPPYYSFVGHHLYDFTIFPVQYLPKKWVKRYIMQKHKVGQLTPEIAFQQFETLNKLSIRKMKKILDFLPNKNFRVIDENFLITYPNKFEYDVKILSRFGFISEFLTMLYVFVLEKL